MRKFSFIVAAMLLIAGCELEQRQGPTDDDIAAIKAQIDGLTVAYVARDWDAFAGFFTADGVWMPPGFPPLSGKNEWWSFVQPWWDESEILDIGVTTEQVVVSGNWAIEWHTEYQTAKLTPDAEPASLYFKGSWIFHRQGDGTWKIAQYIWNENVAPE